VRYDKEIHHRRSIRLKDYDYSQAGAYFVTICTQGRECLFGDITRKEILLNDAGQMVTKWWIELVNKFRDRYCQVFYANSFRAFILNGFHGS
jgi:hypothetical protein